MSVCSGIEAATVAWHPLGWEPWAFAEIEPSPAAVLAHHYPTVPNLGDMTKFQEWPHATIDLLVGGTPCQSFSVAGLRKGLADPRGNLMLTFGSIANKYRPRWLVWENVPGVLSSNGGRDFGTFLGMLGELGYGFAYRVLDAQHFGVPQRRRRVFVVGCLGDWRRAAAVLFERHSLSGHPAPRRKAGQTAPTIPSRSSAGGGLGTDFDCDGGLIAGSGSLAFGGNNTSGPIDVATALNACASASGRLDFETETFVCGTLKANNGGGWSNSADHAAAGYMVPVAIQERAVSQNPDAGPQGKGFQEGVAMPEGCHDTAKIRAASGGSSRSYIAGSAVRRLTPRECERLQGFPDDYTLIPYRGKPAADGPRYKALGNSMAVPVMRWIGERIAAVEVIAASEVAA